MLKYTYEQNNWINCIGSITRMIYKTFRKNRSHGGVYTKFLDKIYDGIFRLKINSKDDSNAKVTFI